MDIVWTDFDNLREDYDCLNQEKKLKCHELKQVRQKYKEDSQNWEATASAKIDQMKQEAAILRHGQEQAQRQKQQSEEACTRYEQQVQALETTVRSLQEGALQSVESTQWAPMAVSAIEHRLQDILTRVKQWSQQASKLSIDQVLERGYFEEMAASLESLDCLKSPELLRSSIRANKAMQKSGKAQIMLLTAAISSMIFRQVIGDTCFQFAGDQDDGIVLSKGQGNSLYRIIELVRKRKSFLLEHYREQQS